MDFEGGNDVCSISMNESRNVWNCLVNSGVECGVGLASFSDNTTAGYYSILHPCIKEVVTDLAPGIPYGGCAEPRKYCF